MDGGYNALIHGFQVEHNPAAEDGRTVTVHTDVGDQRITQQQYEVILLAAKDTDTFRDRLFSTVLEEFNTHKSQGGPSTGIGQDNPTAGTVDQRSTWERPSQPPASNISAEARRGTVQQPAVTPGGLPSTPETQEGAETLPVTQGQAADSGGPLVNKQ